MRRLKVLHIVTFQRGGAGIAAMRLHKSLLKEGIQSQYLYLDKGVQSESVFNYRKKYMVFDIFLRGMKKLGMPLNLEEANDYKIRKYKRSFEMFSFAKTPFTKLRKHDLVAGADIINLHFVSNFVDYPSFFSSVNKPVIWTLHDMNPLQGGFHYKDDETRFVKHLYHLNQEQLNLKKESLSQFNGILKVVTPSYWMKEQSLRSELLGSREHFHIPNPIDTSVFKPAPIEAVNAGTGDKRVVLFVAESLYNRRKGFDLLIKMIADEEVMKSCRFIAVGSIRNSDKIEGVEYVGNVSSEAEIARLYNQADIFILPSREDNLPNSMVESLCCGTPVVGFKIGGLAGTIRDGENGYLSEDISVEGLKAALLNCVADLDSLDRKEISDHAHVVFSEGMVAKQYLNVYNGCLSKL